MAKTLHLYFLRELLKAFTLTTIALTILITMGGGVANMFRSQGIDAIRVLKVFALLVPIAVTLVLPVAALFSATITYGRAGADNEINACRAAGLNVHRLLSAAAGLSIAVAVVTFFSWNYIIPSLTLQLYQMGRQDLASVLLNNLRRNRGVPFRNYVLYADDAVELPADKLPVSAPTGRNYVLLHGAAFLEMAEFLPTRCGTTETAVIEIDTSRNMPELRIDLQGVRTYDIGRGQYLELTHQLMGPYTIPVPLGRKLRFEDLTTLRHFAAAPDRIPELNDRTWAVRARLMRVFTYQAALAALDPDLGGRGAWTIEGPDVSYDIRPREFAASEEEGQPLLRNVIVVERTRDGARQLKAESGTIRVHETLDRTRPVVQIELTGGVESRTLAPVADGRVVKLPSEKLRPVPLLASVRERLNRLTDADILDPRVSIALPQKVAAARQKLFVERARTLCEVQSVISFRSSYAVSTLPVVILGAILGIVLRGGQVLTAFCISCVPSLVVVVGTIVGRNLADHPQTAEIGIATMWFADGFLAVATIWIAARFLRR